MSTFEKKSILLQDTIIPTSVTNDVTVNEIKQVVAQSYWNNYSDCELISIIRVEVVYENTQMYIHLYHGIGYKHAEVKDKLIVTLKPLELDTDLYYATSTNNDSYETKKLESLLSPWLFEGTDEKGSLMEEDCCFIENLATKLDLIENTVFDEKISNDEPDLQALANVGEKYFALAKNRLYKVFAIVDNDLHELVLNLSKLDAEAKFIEVCKHYYREDALLDYAEEIQKPLEDFTIDDFKEYYQSNPYSNYADDAKVSMEVM